MEIAADYKLKSAVSGIDWPGLPSPEGAALLALQYQLEQSQWWPREKLAARQFHQLRNVLSHTVQTIPCHRERPIAAGIDPAGNLDFDACTARATTAGGKSQIHVTRTHYTPSTPIIGPTYQESRRRRLEAPAGVIATERCLIAVPTAGLGRG
jgi:hypothetical protein